MIEKILIKKNLSFEISYEKTFKILQKLHKKDLAFRIYKSTKVI